MKLAANVYLVRNGWAVFFLFFVGYLILGMIKHNIIFTADYYYDYLNGQVEDSRLEEVVTKTMNFSKFKIMWEPLSALLGVLGATLCIHLGLMHQEDKINFDAIFRIALASHLIFLVPGFLRIFMHLNQTGFSPTEFDNYSIGSLSFLLSEEDSYWIQYVFRTFNIFEVIYWALLVIGIKSRTGWDSDRTIRVVLVSYGLGLLFWMIVYLYLTMVIFSKQ